MILVPALLLAAVFLGPIGVFLVLVIVVVLMANWR